MDSHLPIGQTKPRQNARICTFRLSKGLLSCRSSKGGSLHTLLRAVGRLSCCKCGDHSSVIFLREGPLVRFCCSGGAGVISIELRPGMSISRGRFLGRKILKGKLSVLGEPLRGRLSMVSAEESGAPVEPRE